eukprot:TRINITY_DN2569_c0_g1_i18.p1 TRINITY_DN2569_c0_g1~~TRINITY_DN2569_c0_g1_i18.p1  ORF type:complete len:153 (+),score=10.64 TRINITY_DN2569_c0_g1_i18:818-1276(+)
MTRGAMGQRGLHREAVVRCEHYDEHWPQLAAQWIFWWCFRAQMTPKYSACLWVWRARFLPAVTCCCFTARVATSAVLSLFLARLLYPGRNGRPRRKAGTRRCQPAQYAESIATRSLSTSRRTIQSRALCRERSQQAFVAAFAICVPLAYGPF